MTGAQPRTGGRASPQLPFVSVIIPVRDREDTIERSMLSILHARYPEGRREIVVVDNGSTDRTAQLVRGFPVRLVSEPRPGLSLARNRGIEESRGKILAFTDADCYVTTRWLEELVAGLRIEDAAAVTGEVVPYPPSTPAEHYSARRKPSIADWQRSQAEPWFCFMNTAVRRAAFDRVGPFDPSFSGVGCEDVDFAWRFFDAGLQVHRTRQPVVFHQQRLTTRGLFHQQLRNGRGWARLHRAYPNRAHWSWRQEVAAWADLGRAALRVGSTRATWRSGDHPAIETDYLYHDLVLKLGQRLGFVQGRLAGVVESLSTDGRSDSP